MSDSNRVKAFDQPLAKWQGQWLGWLGLATFIFFLWLPNSYLRMMAMPWILVWQVGFLAFTIWAFWLLRQFQHPFRSLGHGFDWWIAALIVVLIITGLASSFTAFALWSLCMVLPYVFLLYVLHNWVDRSWLTRERLWLGLVITMGLTAIVSLSFWRPEPGMWQTGDFNAAIRNAMPLGHHNFVGGYFALTVPITLAYGLGHKGKKSWIGFGAAILTGLALYVSGSRGAALGLLVWILTFLLVQVLQAKGKQRRRRVATGLLILVAVGGLIFTNPRVRDWVAGLQMTSHQQSAPVIADSPTLDRWFMMRIGANILRDRPLLGTGAGNMSRVSPLYRPIETGTGLTTIQQLHNTPVQLAGELGVWGIGLYLSLVGLITSLVWRLSGQPLSHADRALLYGVAGSFLAYGVSSLTDYQLENIPISSALVILAALLLNLAGEYLQTTSTENGSSRVKSRFIPLLVNSRYLSKLTRRISSMAVIVCVGLYIVAWVPYDLALYFGQQAGLSVEETESQVAINNRALKAAYLAPWDPTFSALATEGLVELDQLLDEANQAEDLDKLILEYAYKTVQAAPNDIWFNHNLAILYQTVDIQKAEAYAERTVQLLPRHDKFGHYVLGQIYLQQQQQQKAIAALTLEGMVNPGFLTWPVWENEPYSAVRSAVAKNVLAEFEQLLAQLPIGSTYYQEVYVKNIFLRWWFGLPVTLEHPELVSPQTRALLVAEEDPQTALEILEEEIQQENTIPLLAAWLAPERYLDAYLQQPAIQKEPQALQDVLPKQILGHRQLRSLLTSTSEQGGSWRVAAAFAYRNASAMNIKMILPPQPLAELAFVRRLGVLPAWSREFPALDRRIIQIQAQSLNLRTPPINGFRLEPELPAFEER